MDQCKGFFFLFHLLYHNHPQFILKCDINQFASNVINKLRPAEEAINVPSKKSDLLNCLTVTPYTIHYTLLIQISFFSFAILQLLFRMSMHSIAEHNRPKAGSSFFLNFGCSCLMMVTMGTLIHTSCDKAKAACFVLCLQMCNSRKPTETGRSLREKTEREEKLVKRGGLRQRTRG